MKKIIFLCFFFVTFAFKALAQTDNAAEFKFEKETYDFGKIPQSKAVSVDFKFINIGQTPLIISAVQPSTTAITSTYTNTPIAKGSAGTITITYDAKVIGPFAKGVIVKSNAKTPIKIVYIKGEVITAPTSN